MTTQTELPNGYYTVPPGKLANAVTWLEMRAPPAKPLAMPLRLVGAAQEDRDACRALFATIGTPWLWSRAFDIGDQVPPHVFFALDDIGATVGVVEFSGLETTGVEISFFGLIPAATGAGLGRRLMAAALGVAFETAERVWLHTCNFDHPSALRFYRACGFVPYATGFELMDDPRQDGSLPPESAPQVPLIGKR